MPEVSVRQMFNYRGGTSDKDYLISIDQLGNGWTVNFAYGRHGRTLKADTKTGPQPVSYMTAKAVYDGLWQERIKKGYKPVGDVTEGYVAPVTNNREHSGMQPQLLNVVTLEEVEELLDDPNWVMQEKHDGRRMMIRSEDNKVISANRQGQISGFPVAIGNDIQSIQHSCVVDGEAVGENLKIFDILECDGKDLKNVPYATRLTILAQVLGSNIYNNITMVETYATSEGKRRNYARLMELDKEGVVFKRRDSVYTAGRPNSGGDHVKYKFYATCSCVVTNINLKRSVGLQVLDENNQPLNVGNVTISPNFDVPAVGDVVEIRYLYAYPEGSLYQPTFLGKRDDVNAEECLVTQLKYKPEETPTMKM